MQQQNAETAFSQPSPGPLPIWFLLVDFVTGQPYKQATASSVVLSCLEVTIAQFRDAVKAKYSQPGYLKDIAASKLLVYKNKAAFDKRNVVVGGEKEVELRTTDYVMGLGKSEKDAVIVAVPESLNVHNTIRLNHSDTGEKSVESLLFEMNQLINLENVKNDIYTAQKPLTTLDPRPNDLVKLKVTSFQGNPDFLFSENIYEDEKTIGIDMPIDKLTKIKADAYVLVGVSGCGKTRTCFDMGRKFWCLYFDCSTDSDVLLMINQIESIRPSLKGSASQVRFENESRKVLKTLFVARLIIWNYLKVQGEIKQDPFTWFCYQRSRRTQILFQAVFTEILKWSFREVSQMYNHLVEQFGGRVIFDEANLLLRVCQFDYHSSTNDNIVDGAFCAPRSLFTFLSSFILADTQLVSVWCGTRMAIRNIELFYPAAGGKDTKRIEIFTDFTYLTPMHISKLLPIWVNVPDDDELIQSISYFLQGRPRLFTRFVSKLLHASDIKATFTAYREELTTNKNPNMNHSFFYFWQDRVGYTISSLQGNLATSHEIVSDILIKLCASFVAGEGTTCKFIPVHDILATNLVMVSLVSNDWTAMMAEPLIITAGLNYFASIDRFMLINHLSKNLFTPFAGNSPTAQERGNTLKLIIAVRFMSGWWRYPEFQEYLPAWHEENISEPMGVLDCRSGSFDQNQFLLPLKDHSYQWLTFPSTAAGPDLIYDMFCVHCKSTWTANSSSSMFVSTEECKNNFSNTAFRNWYQSLPSTNQQCVTAAQSRRFFHLLFELPDSATSMKNNEGDIGDFPNGDSFIRINIQSEFATLFFGESFVKKYIDYAMKCSNQFGKKVSPWAS